MRPAARQGPRPQRRLRRVDRRRRLAYHGGTAEFTAGERVVGLRSRYVVGERLDEGGFGSPSWRPPARRVVLEQLLEGDGAVRARGAGAGRADAPDIPRCHECFATDGARAVDPAGHGELGGDVSLVLVQDHVDGASLAARVAGGARMTAGEAEALLREPAAAVTSRARAW
ncbi:hypothetical protein [Nannocystis punicea]|uniref:Uncharacterized protein n=1 Tax=Nannocystis punicea TaxID=2995304 RepID=A0ABY7HBP4_9BACT|nr:hypothetical protein [Nannocystis poenicansa]WAS96528.1 hypothetical protein O0S08_10255 [Nannocystis poenicansa]